MTRRPKSEKPAPFVCPHGSSCVHNCADPAAPRRLPKEVEEMLAATQSSRDRRNYAKAKIEDLVGDLRRGWAKDPASNIRWPADVDPIMLAEVLEGAADRLRSEAEAEKRAARESRNGRNVKP